MSEINVTPFVDVMLVLLIIFMVAAPLLLSGLQVDLPRVNSNPLNTTRDQLQVVMDRQGKIYLGSSEEPLELPKLKEKLSANAKGREDEQIVFRGDRKVEYGDISQVLGAVSKSGFRKFTFTYGPEDIEDGSKRK